MYTIYMGHVQDAEGRKTNLPFSHLAIIYDISFFNINLKNSTVHLPMFQVKCCSLLQGISLEIPVNYEDYIVQ